MDSVLNPLIKEKQPGIKTAVKKLSVYALFVFPLSFSTWIWFLGIQLKEGSPTFGKVSSLK